MNLGSPVTLRWLSKRFFPTYRTVSHRDLVCGSPRLVAFVQLPGDLSSISIRPILWCRAATWCEGPTAYREVSPRDHMVRNDIIQASRSLHVVRAVQNPEDIRQLSRRYHLIHDRCCVGSNSRALCRHREGQTDPTRTNRRSRYVYSHFIYRLHRPQ